MFRKLLAIVALIFVSSTVANAQVSAGVYGGVTTPHPPTQSSYMIMADWGTKVDVEPWVQSFGPLTQVGVDVILSPSTLKGFGVTAGAYSNTRTERVGVTYTRGNGQVRLMRTNNGDFQGIGLYNFYITKATYLQVWAAPAQGGSSWLVGVGHIFKE